MGERTRSYLFRNEADPLDLLVPFKNLWLRESRGMRKADNTQTLQGTYTKIRSHVHRLGGTGTGLVSLLGKPGGAGWGVQVGHDGDETMRKLAWAFVGWIQASDSEAGWG